MSQHQVFTGSQRFPAWNLAAWVCVCFFLAVAPVSACIWDHDTLKMERQRFPTALELITGKFLRHSPEYYRWRITDREHRLALPENKDDPLLMDDLAVAHHKLGDHKKAIELLLESNQRLPNRYETLANLGTFYMLAGDFEEGRKYIIQALELNPEAHFGREVYQKLLADYVLARRVDGQIKLPLAKEYPGADVMPYDSPEWGNFARFVLKSRPETDSAATEDYHLLALRQQEELKAAIKGVLGMMKFADYQSPILLEVLGDLLHGEDKSDDVKFDAQQLAARAYLLASQQVTDQIAKDAYKNQIQKVMQIHMESITTPSHYLSNGERDWVSDIGAESAKEVAEANRWYEEVRQNELHWIETGADVDAEFARHYYQEPEVLAGAAYGPLRRKQIESERVRTIAVATVALMCLVSLVWYLRKRSCGKPASHESDKSQLKATGEPDTRET
ncbi:MAG: hypothetical protein JWM11_5193 [Planctomycetaceae bacterium]|nr:hypothetical protein [Planctomycetaceae bacterium]